MSLPITRKKVSYSKNNTPMKLKTSNNFMPQHTKNAYSLQNMNGFNINRAPLDMPKLHMPKLHIRKNHFKNDLIPKKLSPLRTTKDNFVI